MLKLEDRVKCKGAWRKIDDRNKEHEAEKMSSPTRSFIYSSTEPQDHIGGFCCRLARKRGEQAPFRAGMGIVDY